MVYIFDMDGTLIDSNKIIHKGIGEYFIRHGVKYDSEIMKKTVPLGYVGTAEFLVKEFGLKKSIETITDELKSITTNLYKTVIPAKPYAVRLIQRLHNEGHMLCILSASSQTMITSCIRRLGMGDCFDKIWSTEDFMTTKFDVSLYKKVAAEIGVPVEDCIVVEDSIVPVTTAKKAGMRVIAVYDEASAGYKDEIMCIADKYINDLSEF